MIRAETNMHVNSSPNTFLLRMNGKSADIFPVNRNVYSCDSLFLVGIREKAQNTNGRHRTCFILSNVHKFSRIQLTQDIEHSRI